MKIYAHIVFVVAAILYVTEAFNLRATRTKRDLNPEGLQGSKELELSASQKAAFEELKAAVKHKIVFPVMMKDIFLIRYLREKEFDVKRAISAVLETISWRIERSMDTIASADLSKGRKLFEADTNGTDVQGRPVLYMQTGNWGLYTAIATNKQRLYMRSFYQLFDEAATKAIETFEKGNSKNAQYVMVLNYDNWTSEEGACGDCVAVVTMLALEFDSHWPDFVHRIVLVNVADDFKLFLDLVRHVLSKETNEKLKAYDRKKSVWCADIKTLFEHKALKSQC